MSAYASIQEQIAAFSAAAEGLSGEISKEEMEKLGKNIAKNAGLLWDYHEMILADSERLKAIADKYSKAAKVQANKAERTKDFLKIALKSNGFTRLTFGDTEINLGEANKIVAARPATDADFLTMPELLRPSFSWKGEPTIDQYFELPALVDVAYEWDMPALKAAKKPELLGTETTYKLRVKISKKD